MCGRVDGGVWGGRRKKVREREVYEVVFALSDLVGGVSTGQLPLPTWNPGYTIERTTLAAIMYDHFELLKLEMLRNLTSELKYFSIQLSKSVNYLHPSPREAP